MSTAHVTTGRTPLPFPDPQKPIDLQAWKAKAAAEVRQTTVELLKSQETETKRSFLGDIWKRAASAPQNDGATLGAKWADLVPDPLTTIALAPTVLPRTAPAVPRPTFSGVTTSRHLGSRMAADFGAALGTGAEVISTLSLVAEEFQRGPRQTHAALSGIDAAQWVMNPGASRHGKSAKAQGSTPPGNAFFSAWKGKRGPVAPGSQDLDARISLMESSLGDLRLSKKHCTRTLMNNADLYQALLRRERNGLPPTPALVNALVNRGANLERAIQPGRVFGV